MRFMMFMIPGVYQGQAANDLPPDFAPPADLVEKMMAFNEKLAKSGALIALDGLQPLGKGARVEYSHGFPTVTDGPFVEAKEVVGGYWIIRANSKEEAIEWAKRCPNPMPEESDLEIRPVFEAEDFGAEFTPELREQEERVREAPARNA